VSKVATKIRKSVSPSPAEEAAPPVEAPKADHEQAFESFYLRHAAMEFSDDLDKLRSANDFKGQSSVELLVGALKQGGACFSKEERSRVGGGGAGVTK
jgi:ribosome assembly protein 3